MKILLIRMLGLGDVAAILVPAVRLVRARHPGAEIDVLTFDAGVDLMTMVPEVSSVLAVTRDQWPETLPQAVDSFLAVGETVLARGYDRIVNLDTWFMPCFLAQALKDHGAPVSGNHLKLPVADLYRRLRAGTLAQRDFSDPPHFLASTFPAMDEWFGRWWQAHPDIWGYPDFYLNHCCGLDGAVDHRIDVAADQAFRAAAGGRPIVALSLQGSKAAKRYKWPDELRRQLEDAGFHVWSQFDGSLPLAVTLARLKATDLLVSVATSTQWLARAVGCPSLIITGALPPVIPGAEASTPAVETCQYCCQTTCPRGLDFPCLDVPPENVAAQAVGFFRL